LRNFPTIKPVEAAMGGMAVATQADVPHLKESAMVPMLFEGLFIIALAVPPLAVCLGVIMLLMPTRMERPASVRRDMPAHA
jgi:hypothetical protein